jgi:hypothetical protein
MCWGVYIANIHTPITSGIPQPFRTHCQNNEVESVNIDISMMETKYGTPTLHVSERGYVNGTVLI